MVEKAGFDVIATNSRLVPAMIMAAVQGENAAAKASDGVPRRSVATVKRDNVEAAKTEAKTAPAAITERLSDADVLRGRLQAFSDTLVVIDNNITLAKGQCEKNSSDKSHPIHDALKTLEDRRKATVDEITMAAAKLAAMGESVPDAAKQLIARADPLPLAFGG